jgi:glycopeptide antibiotics resistance protein
MQKRLVSGIILAVYSGILIKLLVLKNIVFKIGRFRFRFADRGNRQANFLPFKTILFYLQGNPTWLIATINLVGNIALFIPIGFLASIVYPKMTWQKFLVLGITFSLVIELMEVVLRVGIFDIDDIILNALGIMIGFWIFALMIPAVRRV